jgi:mannose-6-phosphate isomerase-like protein (cupin superfamily)
MHQEDHYRADDIVLRQIVVEPGMATQYQIHEERSEFWFVSKGNGLIKTSAFGAESAGNNYMMSEVGEGEIIILENGTAHQISNNGDNDLIIYQLQYGNCYDEDMVVLED